jgi:hypothetical protein
VLVDGEDRQGSPLLKDGRKRNTESLPVQTSDYSRGLLREAHILGKKVNL